MDTTKQLPVRELLKAVLEISDENTLDEVCYLYEAGGLSKIRKDQISDTTIGYRLEAMSELSVREHAFCRLGDLGNIMSPQMVLPHIFATGIQNDDQENFIVLLLTSRNAVIKVVKLYRGTVDSCGIRIAEVFREGIRENATAIIVAHNHPSGDPEPSSSDWDTTREIKQAGDVLDIELLDHIIVSDAIKFVSLKARGNSGIWN